MRYDSTHAERCIQKSNKVGIKGINETLNRFSLFLCRFWVDLKRMQEISKIVSDTLKIGNVLLFMLDGMYVPNSYVSTMVHKNICKEVIISDLKCGANIGV